MADSKPILETEVNKAKLDNMSCKLAGRINGLYYYYLESGLYTSITNDEGLPIDPSRINPPDNTLILGTTDAICNVAYVPFLSAGSKDITRIPYDVKRFGTFEEPTDENQKINAIPYVFRLKPEKSLGEMVICETNLYPPNIQKPILFKKRNHMFEGRLYDYPYRSISFVSNMFDEFEVIPHLVPPINDGYHSNRLKLKAYTAINPGGNFYIFTDFYKKDGSNILERSYSTASVDMPNTSSAYANYMSTQKAQAQNGIWKPVSESMANAIPSVAAATMAGGPVAGAATGIASIFAGMAQHVSAKSSLLAKTQDLITTPNSLKSVGGDLLCRLGRIDSAFVQAYEKTIHDDYKQILGDFFATYGYRQNKVIKLNDVLNTRYFYNYVKTIGCNLKGKHGVPKKHLATMKAIFDNGVTLWHVEKEGVTIGDYQYDNTENKFI